MADERWSETPADPLGLTRGYDPSSEEFAELRELLLGGERRQLEELRRRLDGMGLTAEELADHLPEAIALRAGRDRQLARALAPTVENAIHESVRRNPREIASAIFPVLGPAIRKAIAETMASLVESINRAVEHSVSIRGIRWRLEAWRTGVPYGQIVIKHALVYRVEQVFLVHAETGLLLAHAAAPDLEVADADLISGMLTAIRDFVGDSFGQKDEGGLRTFGVGELTVMVEQGPRAIIAAVVRGQPPEGLLRRLQDTLETFHFQFARPLADFDGDSGAFDSAKPLLAECLVTVLSTDEARAKPGLRVLLPWLVPTVLLVGLFGWLRYRSDQLWRTAVGRLESAPGIVLTRAERDGGRWKFAGLRDPLAPDPAALLAAVGVDPGRVVARWEPYLSFQPTLVIARARRALATPESVTLTLAGDTLTARGSAPISWVGRVSGLSLLPVGISQIDLSAVKAELPTPLAGLRTGIESTRVLFDVGSATVTTSVQRAAGNSVVSRFLELRAAVESLGYTARLDLIGRTDPTGSDSANQALSRWRAEAVQRRLAAWGIPAAVTSVRGIGTTDPLSGPDAAERAQVNRSVSFVVQLTRRGSWGPRGVGEPGDQGTPGAPR